MRNLFQTKLACLALSAAICFWATGCASGLGWFRNDPDGLFADSEDPFLSDTAETLINDVRSASADRSRGELDSLTPASAEAFGDSNNGTNSSLGGRGDEISLVDFEPKAASDGVQLANSSQVKTEAFNERLSVTEKREPGAPPGSLAGLGTVDPWNEAETGPEPDAGPGVGLSFEDGPASTSNGHRVEDFAIDAESWETGSALPEAFEPRAESTSNADETAPDRSGISIIEAPIEQLERSASAIPEAFDKLERKVREERDSLRGRFSRLGARFGLGSEDEQPLSESTVEPRPTRAEPEDCLEDLIARTQTRLGGRAYRDLDESEQQLYLRDHVNLRLFYLVNEQSERALDAIPGIPPAEQEFWQQMFWSLVQYRDIEATPDRTDRATQTAIQLRAALQRLQESAKLQIRNASFCRRINGFGSYDRFERDVFRPGQPVLVYAEIDNFKTEPTTAGQHRTLLRSTLRIFPENGSEKPVDSVTLRAVEDVCRSPRRDYFNSYEFTIPNDIAPGRYLLEITIDDRLADKAARQTVLFSVK